jgi:hypothetical protein
MGRVSTVCREIPSYSHGQLMLSSLRSCQFQLTTNIDHLCPIRRIFIGRDRSQWSKIIPDTFYALVSALPMMGSSCSS